MISLAKKIGALFLGLALTVAAAGGGYYAYTVLSPDPVVVTQSEQGAVITRKSKVDVPEVSTINEKLSPKTVVSDEDDALQDEFAEEDAEAINSVELPYAVGYFTEKLTEDEQIVCRELYKGIYDHKEKIGLKPDVINSEDVCQLIVMVVTCSPDMDYIGKDYSIQVNAEGYATGVMMNYTMTEEEIEERREQMQQRIGQICAEITPAWSDMQKYKLIHDAVVNGCEYSEDSEDCYSPYGCLVEGKAVCEGYSKAVMMLCDYAEIECLPVVGEAFNEDGSFQSHLWNKIRIEDAWYVTDVTWDDPVMDTADNYLRYDYFTMTDEECERNHAVDENRFFNYPECNSTFHDYYIYNGYYAENFDGAFRAFDNAVRDAVINNEDYARIKCSDEECYEQTLNWVYSNGIGSDALFTLIEERAEKQGNESYDASSYSVINDEVMHCITLRLKRK